MIEGIHHVTAMAGDPAANLAFYTQRLALRLVKKTVNFDDPSTYHLYYGDTTGRPGTTLTFFPWPQVHRGRRGRGQITAVAYAVPHNTLEHWAEQLRDDGINIWGPDDRFGAFTLGLEDPDGLQVELIEQPGPTATSPWASARVPRNRAPRGFHSVTLTVGDYEPTVTVLTDILGYQFVSQEGDRYRLTTTHEGPGTIIDILHKPDASHGRPGRGSIHHVAFGVPDREAQMTMRERLIDHGLQVTPVKDRKYFQSIYFHEPGGILFEIATNGPGFLIDEDEDELGTHLQLPDELEHRRTEIEKRLPPLTSETS